MVGVPGAAVPRDPTGSMLTPSLLNPSRRLLDSQGSLGASEPGAVTQGALESPQGARESRQGRSGGLGWGMATLWARALPDSTGEWSWGSTKNFLFCSKLPSWVWHAWVVVNLGE